MNAALVWLVAAAIVGFGAARADGVVRASEEGSRMIQTSGARATRTGDMEITVRRRFAVPPDRVFAALTTPELLRQWMSAAGRDLVECQVDLRDGGSYRFVFRSASGKTFGMYGSYRQVVPGRRIVHTEAYDGYDWDPLVTTTELEQDDAGTALVMTITYPSKTVCDTDFPNVASASEEGFARLDALLAR
jgi:uncharacterized protein YndB with AHSA1/START domain